MGGCQVEIVKDLYTQDEIEPAFDPSNTRFTNIDHFEVWTPRPSSRVWGGVTRTTTYMIRLDWRGKMGEGGQFGLAACVRRSVSGLRRLVVM
jgi:hypothetical protein